MKNFSSGLKSADLLKELVSPTMPSRPPPPTGYVPSVQATTTTTSPPPPPTRTTDSIRSYEDLRKKHFDDRKVSNG